MNNIPMNWAAYTEAFGALGWVFDKLERPDTSKDRKAKKARARELSMQRMAELQMNPKPKKKKGKKK